MLKVNYVLATRLLLDGTILYSNNPKELLEVFLTSRNDFHCWSADALQEFLKGTLEIISEFGVQVKKDLKLKNSPNFSEVSRNFTTFQGLKTKILQHLPNKQEQLVTIVYNLLLSISGNGLLPNFGMSNRHGDKINKNPEKETICELPLEIPERRAIQ